MPTPSTLIRWIVVREEAQVVSWFKKVGVSFKATLLDKFGAVGQIKKRKLHPGKMSKFEGPGPPTKRSIAAPCELGQTTSRSSRPRPLRREFTEPQRSDA